jgi:trans-aconitate methyltransferase
MLGDLHHYQAIDLSQDMLTKGQKKLPQVHWHLGRAEEILPTLPDIDLLLSAQSFHWMDRPQILSTIRERLTPQGRVAVMHNNRHYHSSDFLGAYETLLEETVPGYTRNYRTFDYRSEMAEYLQVQPDEIHRYTHVWVRKMTFDDFLGMSRSSSKVQPAIQANGQQFMSRVRALLEQYGEGDQIGILYQSELFLYAKTQL